MTSADKKSDGRAYRLTHLGFSLGRVEGAAPTEPDAAPTSPAADLAEIGDRFITRLQLLWTYVNEIGNVARATSFTNMASVLALTDEVAEAAKGRDPETASAIFRLNIGFTSEDNETKSVEFTSPVFEYGHLKSLQARQKYHNAALRILHETAIQQLVNSFERLLGDIVGRHISRHTADAGDQKLSYRELLEFSSLEEAKRRVVEKQVTDFIRGNDAVEQLKFIKDVLKVDVRSLVGNIDVYRELVIRRHAIVHAGGVATPEYIRRLRSIGGFTTPAEGSLLPLPVSYVHSSWDEIYALGVVTLHSIARHEVQRAGNPDDVDVVDSWLNSAGYWSIEQGRLTAAERIFGYGNALRLAKDGTQLMVLVNLAQTKKWLGKDAECRTLLAGRDWESTSSLFRGCVGALTGADFERHLINAVQEGALTIDKFYEWPVFGDLRKRDDVMSLIERVFGPGKTAPVDKFPASLLDWSHETTIKRLGEHLEGHSLKIAKPRAGRQPIEDPDIDDSEAVH